MRIGLENLRYSGAVIAGFQSIRKDRLVVSHWTVDIRRASSIDFRNGVPRVAKRLPSADATELEAVLWRGCEGGSNVGSGLRTEKVAMESPRHIRLNRAPRRKYEDILRQTDES